MFRTQAHGAEFGPISHLQPIRGRGLFTRGYTRTITLDLDTCLASCGRHVSTLYCVKRNIKLNFELKVSCRHGLRRIMHCLDFYGSIPVHASQRYFEKNKETRTQ